MDSTKSVPFTLIKSTQANFHTVHRAQTWLGTLVEISVHSTQSLDATHQAIEHAFAACQRVHNAMSSQLSTSDVSRFNVAPSNTTLTFDPWTIQVLKAAQRLQLLSGCMFDISLGSTPFATLAYTILNSTQIVKHFADSKLDLGGIAKGYAVDRMVATLRAGGIRNGCVNAGGDLRSFGQEHWPVWKRQIASNEGANQAATLEPWITISNGSVASSEYMNGRSPLHADTLHSPNPANLVRILKKNYWIAVAAPRCMWADALTKVVALSENARHPILAAFGAHAWLEQTAV